MPILVISTAVVEFVLLLTVIITWISYCCRSNSNNRISENKVKHLITALYVIGFLCLVSIAGSLCGNQWIYQSSNWALTEHSDLYDTLDQISNEQNSVNEFHKNITQDINHLMKLNKYKMEYENINETVSSSTCNYGNIL